MDPAAPLERCITCSDEGLPMRVLALADEAGLAICADESGTDHSIAVDLLESVAVGDDILAHAGVAIAHMGRCGA